MVNSTTERRIQKNFADVYEGSDLYGYESVPCGLRQLEASACAWAVLIELALTAEYAKAAHLMLLMRASRTLVEPQCRRTDALISELSVPPEGSQPLSFPTRYSRNWVRSCEYERTMLAAYLSCCMRIDLYTWASSSTAVLRANF